MRRTRGATWAAVSLALGIGIACGFAATVARAADRPPDEILRELDETKIKAAGRGSAESQTAKARRAELIKELAQAAPDHPRLGGLWPERWQTLAANPKTARDLASELDQAMRGQGRASNEAAYFKAVWRLGAGPNAGSGFSPDPTREVDEFIKRSPKDERGAMLLNMAAMQLQGVARSNTLKRIVIDYPDSRYADSARGSLRQMESVGLPFEMEFVEAVTGSTIDAQSLKGKVVVVDFWATWCGPCVAEMPRLKKLYAKYHGQGVEFIGVSLDNSVERLREYVRDQQIPWPQYYEGKIDSRAFAESWGVLSIPSMFVLDQEGRLVTVEGRDQLEALIPALLKQRR